MANKEIKIDGQVYKIGFRGKVYVKRDDEWVLNNNYEPAQIKRMINRSSNNEKIYKL